MNFESLPSVKEIISKVEALSNQSEKHVMSSPLKMTHEKPPILLSQRTAGNHRPLDNYQNQVSQIEPQTPVSKRLSGMYKKVRGCLAIYSYIKVELNYFHNAIRIT